jgi:hypothetical protein
MSLVGVFRSPALGHQQHSREQEQEPLTPSKSGATPSAPSEGTFQHQLPKRTELRAGPATQPPLYFLPGPRQAQSQAQVGGTHTGQDRGVSDRDVL